MDRNRPDADAAPSGAGVANSRKAPEQGSFLNDAQLVVDIHDLLESPKPAETTARSILLSDFTRDPCTLAPGIPIRNVLDGFGLKNHGPVLLAAFSAIVPDGTSTDSVLYYCLRERLPLLVLAFARDSDWEFGVPADKRDHPLIRVCSPGLGLIRDLGIGHPEDEARQEVSNGLFLLTYEEKADKYRFAFSWLAASPRLPHDLQAVDKRLSTLRFIIQKTT